MLPCSIIMGRKCSKSHKLDKGKRRKVEADSEDEDVLPCFGLAVLVEAREGTFKSTHTNEKIHME